MFNVKAKTKLGQCAAMRCKEPTVGDGRFCLRHQAEYEAAGVEPTAIVPTSEAPKSGAAVFSFEALRTEIEPTRANLEETLRAVSTLPIDRQEVLDALGQARAFARQAHEWLDDKRKAAKAPHLEAGKACDAAFRPSLDVAQAVIDCVTKRLTEFESARKATQDIALAAVGQGAADKATLVAAHGGELDLPEGSRKREVLRVRILDAAKVPVAFMQLDESLALSYARQRGGKDCKIPGLEFFTEEKVI